VLVNPPLRKLPNVTVSTLVPNWDLVEMHAHVDLIWMRLLLTLSSVSSFLQAMACILESDAHSAESASR